MQNMSFDKSSCKKKIGSQYVVSDTNKHFNFDLDRELNP